MYPYHPAAADTTQHDRTDSISTPLNQSLLKEYCDESTPFGSNERYNQETACIDTTVFIDDSITTGWNLSLYLLLINSTISLLWGIALSVFASGVVPVTWSVSQYGQNHLTTTNIIVTLVATVSTTHLRYLIQQILQQYSSYVIVDGFTLRQLTWMQGIKEWSLSTVFLGRRRIRFVWLVIYAGMAVHSASVVAILQPNTFYLHFPFNDPIPCGVDPESLTLDIANNLPAKIQAKIDKLSFGIGLQLGNYFEQVGGNTTTSVAGRVYRKDNYAYGAIGGLANGLQETPGAKFSANCTNDPNAPNLLDLWSSVFPGRTPPTITQQPDGSQSFSDQSIPSEMRSIVSDTSFNLTGSQVGMYALLNASGSGGLLTVNATGYVLGCVWQATPQLVFVQTVNFVARSLGSQDSNTVPQLTGRAVLLTLQGMAQAIHLGANIGDGNDLVEPAYTFLASSMVLPILLADGGKASVTSFNVYSASLFPQHHVPTGVSICSSNNRTIAAHWKFGNAHNLGWVAVVWTTGVGVIGIIALIWFKRHPRMQEIKPLEVAHAFVLGRGSRLAATVDAIKQGNQPLCVRDGRVVKA